LPKAPEGAEWAPPPVVVDRVVYRNDGAGNRPQAFYQLFVVSADGGALRQLTDGPFDHDGRSSWSPDASRFLYLLCQSRR
jgi:Tol biopolymer transport system component